MPPHLFWIFFFFTEVKFTSKKLVLNEYKICLKLLEMAIFKKKLLSPLLRAGMGRPISSLSRPLDKNQNGGRGVITNIAINSGENGDERHVGDSSEPTLPPRELYKHDLEL